VKFTPTQSSHCTENDEESKKTFLLD